jgi:hypothetical protein
MIPVQYREESTDTILDFGYEPQTPRIGERRCLGRHEYEVLYRWQCGPTSCVVYVRPVGAQHTLAS